MTVADLKKAIEGLPDDTPVLYAWTWRSPSTISLGRYLGAKVSQQCLLFDEPFNKHGHGNEVLYHE